MQGSEQRYRKKVKENLKKDPIIYYQKIFPTSISLEDVIDTHLEDSEFIPDDPIQAKFIITHLSSSEVELLLLRFMGYNSQEVTRIMGLKNVFWYYRLSDKLKRNTDRLMNI